LLTVRRQDDAAGRLTDDGDYNVISLPPWENLQDALK
jgi:hypothetical protein